MKIVDQTVRTAQLLSIAQELWRAFNEWVDKLRIMKRDIPETTEGSNLEEKEPVRAPAPPPAGPSREP